MNSSQFLISRSLVEDAQARGLLRLTRDEKTGQNTVRLPGTDT